MSEKEKTIMERLSLPRRIWNRITRRPCDCCTCAPEDTAASIAESVSRHPAGTKLAGGDELDATGLPDAGSDGVDAA